MRFVKYALAFSVILLLIAELVLRFAFGFCNAPLYRTSDKYEYILKSGQDCRRFGARVLTNSYGMRSDEPDTTRRRVLGLGDSVLFGCTWLDHDSLATTLFTNATGIQMLNIACGSWGPSNCFEFLKENGTFGAEAMILVVSSHDAFDEMTFYPVVGNAVNYPDKQYPLALVELWHRYAKPWMEAHTHSRPKRYTDEPDPDKRVVMEAQFTVFVHQKANYFTKGFDHLFALSKEADIPLIIYLHAELGELQAGHYNAMGQMIIDWAAANGVRLIKGVESESAGMYHDNIHLNAEGQRHLAEVFRQIGL